MRAETDRYDVTSPGLLGAAVPPPGGLFAAVPHSPLQKGREAHAGVSAPEELMKEHEVLARCLGIYEEGAQRLESGLEVSREVFLHTASLVRTFVEEYHEKTEENLIFPIFRRSGKLTDLVDMLDAQHKAGRAITAEILHFSGRDRFRGPEASSQLARACREFILMYRSHEAREDAVLFPALSTLLAPSQILALAEQLEEAKMSALGKGGIEGSIKEVAAIEKQLGIRAEGRSHVLPAFTGGAERPMPAWDSVPQV